MCIWWSMYHATPEALDETAVKCNDVAALSQAYNNSRVHGAGEVALRSCVLRRDTLRHWTCNIGISWLRVRKHQALAEQF